MHTPHKEKMTSEERHETRYQRRKKKREIKAMELSARYTAFEDIFGYGALLEAFNKCKNGVMWKASVQAYKANLLTNTEEPARKIRDGTWKSKGFHEFDIVERGKPRHIQSVHISERCIQRSLCDNSLIPILKNSMIYDNGASLSGKGTDFALRRFTCHLQRHYRKYGRKGGIYFFDFSGYFSNINNYPLAMQIRKKVMDEHVMKMTEQFIFAFGETGLGLGSQVSQISAIYYPTDVDHYAKDHLGIDNYGRYMDDGYIIWPDTEELKQIAEKFEQKCEEKGIIMNRKKCRIIKLHKQFKFLKIRFFVTESGKVVKRISREAVTKERKMLRKFKGFLAAGKMDMKGIRQSFHAWMCSLTRGKSFWVCVNMIAYFNKIYREEGGYHVPDKNTKQNRILRIAAIRAAAVKWSHRPVRC